MGSKMEPAEEALFYEEKRAGYGSVNMSAGKIGFFDFFYLIFSIFITSLDVIVMELWRVYRHAFY